MPRLWRLTCGITQGPPQGLPALGQPMRDEIGAQAERLAEEAGLSIEFIRTCKSFRKERRIK